MPQTPRLNRLLSSYKQGIHQFIHRNQYIIRTGDEIMFRSYSTNIASYNFLTGKFWYVGHDYSATTRRHLSAFLKALPLTLPNGRSTNDIALALAKV